MNKEKEDNRFDRVKRLIGDKKFKKLKDSFVLIIGIGAVGGYAIEAIARSGVENIKIIDFDFISESNINRQILAITSTIGRKKVEVAKERILEINPNCKVKALHTFFHIDKADELLGKDFNKEKPDVIIDAIDSVAPKAVLLIEALKLGIPIVSSMGAALKSDPSHIKSADLMHTHGCPLAKVMRKKVRQAGFSKGISAVYSNEKSPLSDFEVEHREVENIGLNPELKELNIRKKEGRPRRILGSLPTVTAIFGLTIANNAIKILMDRE